MSWETTGRTHSPGSWIRSKACARVLGGVYRPLTLTMWFSSMRSGRANICLPVVAKMSLLAENIVRTSWVGSSYYKEGMDDKKSRRIEISCAKFASHGVTELAVLWMRRTKSQPGGCTWSAAYHIDRMPRCPNQGVKGDTWIRTAHANHRQNASFKPLGKYNTSSRKWIEH